VEYASGNIFIREMRFEKAGDVIDGHTHNFDHTTYVACGALLIEALNDDGSVKQAATKRASDGHNWVLIKKEVKHRITALESHSVGHCIYAHRNPQGEVVQEYGGWRTGYV
jgi:quercetin dioxygenase-like cupin family protein